MEILIGTLEIAEKVTFTSNRRLLYKQSGGSEGTEFDAFKRRETFYTQYSLPNIPQVRQERVLIVQDTGW